MDAPTPSASPRRWIQAKRAGGGGSLPPLTGRFPPATHHARRTLRSSCSATGSECCADGTTDRPSPMRICFVFSEIRYSLLVTDSKIVAISTILDLRTAPTRAVVLNVFQSA